MVSICRGGANSPLTHWLRTGGWRAHTAQEAGGELFLEEGEVVNKKYQCRAGQTPKGAMETVGIVEISTFFSICCQILNV